MNNTRIVELVIEDDNQELAIDAISLVSAPAIEQDFVFFGKEKNNLTFAKVDEEKRMLVSPALIPNKQIFRYDPNTDSDYYVYFSPETVRKASELYLKHNNHHKATHEHSERVSGVLTVESWIIEDTKTDKSTLYGFSLPKGTWMVKMKIENEDLWQKIKSGELKGLSIEGYFTDKMEKMSETTPTTEEVRTALKELLSVQKVELALVDDLVKKYDGIKSEADSLTLKARKAAQELDEVSSKSKSMLKQIADVQKLADEIYKSAEDLGVGLPNEAEVAVRQIDAYRSDMAEVSSTTAKASDLIFGLM
jgi:hypothetical protein